MKVPLDGGAPVALASAQAASAIVVDANSVYFLNGAAVVKVPLGGGVLTQLALDQSPPLGTAAGGIAVDATSVYWTQIGAVMKVPLGGGPSTTLAPLLDMQGVFSVQSTVAVHGANVYWLDFAVPYLAY
jgi:hypothetical protein